MVKQAPYKLTMDASIRCTVLILVISCVSIVVHCTTELDDGVVVSTTYGPIRGVRTDKARQFLGIPFASPPTGELRYVNERICVSVG